MPAAIPIIAAVVSTAGVAVEMNQQKQAQKGASNAAKDEQIKADAAIADQKKTDSNNLNQKASQANATQQGALSAIRAAMSATTSSGGTVLGGANATVAPTATKTLLGV